MKVINKAIFSTLLSLFALSSPSSANATGQTDAEQYCSACHGIIINGVQMTGTGGRRVLQRTYAGWVTTIERHSYFNDNPVIVPVALIPGIIQYLFGPPSATCYKFDGTIFVAEGTFYCPAGSSATPPPVCMTAMYMLSPNQQWTCVTIPPQAPVICTGTGSGDTYYYYASAKGQCN